MGLTLEEMETSILFDRASDIMSIYSADPLVMRKLDATPGYKLIKEDRQDGQRIAATYEAPKKLLTLRSARAKRTLSDEQRAALVERLHRAKTAKAVFL